MIPRRGRRARRNARAADGDADAAGADADDDGDAFGTVGRAMARPVHEVDDSDGLNERRAARRHSARNRGEAGDEPEGDVRVEPPPRRRSAQALALHSGDESAEAAVASSGADGQNREAGDARLPVSPAPVALPCIPVAADSGASSPTNGTASGSSNDSSNDSSASSSADSNSDTSSSSSSSASSASVRESSGAAAESESRQLTKHKFESCEEEGHGWTKFRSWMDRSIVICDDGPTTISCALIPGHNPPRAYFCYFSNLFEYAPRPAPPKAVNGTAGGVHGAAPAVKPLHGQAALLHTAAVLVEEPPRWIAYCKKRAVPGGPRLFFEELPQDDGNVMLLAFQLRPPPPARGQHTHGAGAAHVHKVLEIVEDPAVHAKVKTGKVPMAVVHGEVRRAAVAPQPLTYIAFGDCRGGNPGHCIGDSINLYVVRGLMKGTRKDTRVVLHSGFGGSTYTTKVNVGAGDKSAMLSKHEAGHTFIDDWHALAGTIHDASHEIQGWSIAPVRLLPQAAFSPLGLHSPHWRAHRDSKCRGKAPVAIEYQRTLARHFREHTFQGIEAIGGCEWIRSLAANVGGLPEASAAGAATSRRLLAFTNAAHGHAPAVGVAGPSLPVLPADGKPHVGAPAGQAPMAMPPPPPKPAPAPAVRAAVKYPPIRMLNADKCRVDVDLDAPPPHSNVIVWLLRPHSKERQVKNAQQLGEAIAKAHPDHSVVLLDPSALSSYGEQAMLFHLSHVIMGIHGGAMWNAARWMSGELDQRMLEIMPVLGPGTTCNIAEMMGLRYRHVVCKACNRGSLWRGVLPESDLMPVLGKLLAPNPDGRFETNCTYV